MKNNVGKLKNIKFSRLWKLLFLCFIISSGVWAESTTLTLPILFSAPDTGIGYGVMTEVRTSTTDNIKSSFGLSAYGTQKKQSAFSVFGDTRVSQYRLLASAGVEHTLDYFYGIGKRAHWDDFEKYSAAISAGSLSVLLPVTQDVFVGPVFTARRFQVTEIERDKVLFNQDVPGSTGLTAQGLGGQLIIDTRDFGLSPHAGSYFNFSVIPYYKQAVTDYAFCQTNVDYRYYYDLQDDRVLASQVQLRTVTGEIVPWPMLTSFDLRGYSVTRWLDRNSVTLQTEYRFPLNESFNAALFLGAGQIADSLQHLSFGDMHTLYGGGLRYWLDKMNRLCVRVDIALGQDGAGLYIVLHEAF